MYLSVLNWLSLKNKLKIEATTSVHQRSNLYVWDDGNGIFSVDTTSLFLKGYYMLEVTVHDADSKMNSNFYINQNTISPKSFKLPIKESGCYKRICYFPEKVESIQWSPSQCAGSLESVDLVLKKVTKGFAKSRMLKKLKLKQFNGDMKGLLSAYDQCFEFSNNHVLPDENSDALGEEKVFFVSASGMECLMQSSSDVSEQEKLWAKNKEASVFTRTKNGLIKRLDK